MGFIKAPGLRANVTQRVDRRNFFAQKAARAYTATCVAVKINQFHVEIRSENENSSCLDGQIDCGPEAEDEDDCEITEDMIKKMKGECEANTLSRHVMCPNTLICIKEDWLCGEKTFWRNP